MIPFTREHKTSLGPQEMAGAEELEGFVQPGSPTAVIGKAQVQGDGGFLLAHTL